MDEVSHDASAAADVALDADRDLSSAVQKLIEVRLEAARRCLATARTHEAAGNAPGLFGVAEADRQDHAERHRLAAQRARAAGEAELMRIRGMRDAQP